MRNHLEHLWGLLNQSFLDKANDEEICFDKFAFDELEIEKYFLGAKTEYKVIQILSRDFTKLLKDLLFLKKSGISIINVFKILDLFGEILVLLKLRRHQSHSRFFQDKLLEERNLSTVCPFHGNQLHTSQSVVLPNKRIIFYRFVSTEVFYVIVRTVWRGFPKSAIYFPKRELIIELETPRWQISSQNNTLIPSFKGLLVSNFKQFYSYFQDNDHGRKTALIIGHENFAHHLWNELSGVERLAKHKLINTIDYFFVLREPLGSLIDIFPEIDQQKIVHVASNKIWHEVLDKNCLALNVGDFVIGEALCDRVHKVAQNKCAVDVLSQAQTAKNTCFPLLWISVRIGNRTLEDQENCLVSTISSLAKSYPKLGVVFDGFSFPSDFSDDRPEKAFKTALGDGKILGDGKPESIHDIINKQNLLVANICSRFTDQKIAFFNIIGCSLHEANVWAHAADLYIAHHGTLQHKIGWLANKPGVVHANRKVVSGFKWILGVRENENTPKYLRKSFVRDSKAAVSDNYQTIYSQKRADNYFVDYKALYREVVKITNSLSR